MPHDREPIAGLPASAAAMAAGLASAPTPAAAIDATVPISTAAVTSIIALGCVALLMMGIQPLVLGALQAAGRLSVPAMGQAATAETLALGVVSALMAARVPHKRLRAWGLAGVLLLVVANGVGTLTSGFGFVLSRGLAGLASGVIVWIAVGLITRRSDASRVNAIFLGAQALSQGAVAALAPTLLAPALGADSGLWVIAGGAVLVTPLLLLLPSELPRPPAAAHLGSGLHLASLSGLAATLLMMAGIVGVWVYVEPIARAIHVPAQVVSLAIAASLGAQVLGAVIIVSIDRWVKPVAGLLAVAAAFMGVTAALAWSGSQTAFVAATLAFGVLWTFALALTLPLLLAADPTRRAPMYGPAATLLGGSLGPLAAGALATETDLGPALAVSGGLFVLSAIAVAVSALTRRRPA